MTKIKETRIHLLDSENSIKFFTSKQSNVSETVLTLLGLGGDFN
ncbi:hypothetical protein [uncultured Aquimarina sp.]|nr:hypothetical protein [uncultured Aquimarina sp.]